jgi:hypothetical protein
MDSQWYIYSNKEGLPVGQKKKWIVNRYISSKRDGLTLGHVIHAGVGEKGWIVNRYTFLPTDKACP